MFVLLGRVRNFVGDEALPLEEPLVANDKPVLLVVLAPLGIFVKLQDHSFLSLSSKLHSIDFFVSSPHWVTHQVLVHFVRTENLTKAAEDTLLTDLLAAHIADPVFVLLQNVLKLQRVITIES